MRKLLLVILIGMVLALNIFGAVKQIVSMIEEKELDTIPAATVVYVEE